MQKFNPKPIPPELSRRWQCHLLLDYDLGNKMDLAARSRGMKRNAFVLACIEYAITNMEKPQ